MEAPPALDHAWDEITLPSVPRGDFDPPPWVSSVEPSEAPSRNTGLLLAVLLAGIAGTFVGLFILGA